MKKQEVLKSKIDRDLTLPQQYIDALDEERNDYYALQIWAYYG
jgi:hypothetical protein